MSSVIVEETFAFSAIICGVWQKPIPQGWCLSLSPCEFQGTAAAKEAINGFNKPGQALPAGG